MPWKTYPNQKKKLLKLLGKDEIEMLKKDYPFRGERNTKIFELRQKGISIAVLMSLTGLCKNSILQICQLDRDSQREGDLIKIKMVLDVLSRKVKKLLKQRRS